MEKECIYGLLESVKTVWCHKVIKFELTIAVIDTLTEDGHARFWSVVYDKIQKCPFYSFLLLDLNNTWFFRDTFQTAH